MQISTPCLTIAVSFLVCGCSSAPVPPLFFGDKVTVGLDVGAGAGSTGVDFNLGFNQKSIAIVPVSAVNDEGKAEVISGQKGTKENKGDDALSVFGQFKMQGGSNTGGETGKPPRSIALGRFFATGIAATNLAEGYKTGWEDTKSQHQRTGDSSAGSQIKQGTISSGTSNQVSSQSGNSVSSQRVDDKQATKQETCTTMQGSCETPLESTKPSQSNPHNPPLVFAQSHSLGIGIATSVADQGSHFTLGLSAWDIAIVPVMAQAKDGSLSRLGGRGSDDTGVDGKSTEENDSYSVFGQFENNTETTAVNFGLNTFFTTGIAARYLTTGYKAAIARELQAQRAQMQSSTTSSSGATTGK